MLATETNRDAGNPAGAALRRAGPLAVPRLIKVVEADDSVSHGLKRAVERLLGRNEQRALADAVLRADCAELLGEVAPTSPIIVQTLLGAVRGADAPVDVSAALALREIARHDTNVATQIWRLSPELMQIHGDGVASRLEVARIIRSHKFGADAEQTDDAPTKPNR